MKTTDKDEFPIAYLLPATCYLWTMGRRLADGFDYPVSHKFVMQCLYHLYSSAIIIIIIIIHTAMWLLPIEMKVCKKSSLIIPILL